MKITLSRKANGEYIFDDATKAKIAIEFPPTKPNPRVTPGVGGAADKQFTEMAKALAFDQKISFTDAVNEMIRREPVLFRLSRAPIADPGYADIGALS